MRQMMSCLSSIVLVALPLLTQVASASNHTTDDERLRNSGTVLKEILDVPDSIPQDLLDKADCVGPEGRVHRRWKLRSRCYVVPQR